MTIARNSLAIALALILAFSFGWSANGYRIYKGFFNQTVSTTNMVGVK